MPLSQLYHRLILEHNRRPRNHHPLDYPTHRARGLDALCGDDIECHLVVEQGRIRAAAFFGVACAVTTATASILSDWLRDRSVAEVAEAATRFRRMLDAPESPADPYLGELGALKPVGRFPARKRNALLPWQTVVAALANQHVAQAHPD